MLLYVWCLFTCWYMSFYILIDNTLTISCRVRSYVAFHIFMNIFVWRIQIYHVKMRSFNLKGALTVGQVKNESNGTRDNDMTTENDDMSMNVGDTYINVFEDIDD